MKILAALAAVFIAWLIFTGRGWIALQEAFYLWSTGSAWVWGLWQSLQRAPG